MIIEIVNARLHQQLQAHQQLLRYQLKLLKPLRQLQQPPLNQLHQPKQLLAPGVGFLSSLLEYDHKLKMEIYLLRFFQRK